MKGKALSFCYENEYKRKGFKLIAGVDEAGRGPLAGPLVCAAVILKDEVKIEGLDDSKKLTRKKREELLFSIVENSLAISIAILDEKTIDAINIYQSAKWGMIYSILNLKIKPDFVLSDAMKLEELNIPYLSIIKGDAKSPSIAAASIIAKTTRDNIMFLYSKKFPEYKFNKNMGYPTREHISAIKKNGILSIHRKTFSPVSRLI